MRAAAGRVIADRRRAPFFGLGVVWSLLGQIHREIVSYTIT